MNKLNGRVLVVGLDVGVPNLVVAAFDAERELREVGPTRATDRATGAIAMDRLRRLGSVITDGRGTFTFSAEDLGFGGNEARPDLVIAVFAPEDVQGLEHPFPLPAEQRLLYLSYAPRVDAGAEESYVIRILPAQLDRFRIPSAQPSRVETSSRSYLAAVGAKASFRQAVTGAMRPLIHRQVQASTELRKVAREMTAAFFAPRAQLRDRAYLLTDDASLAEVQHAAIRDGLASRIARSRGRLRLRLSAEEAAALDLQRDEHTGAVSGRARQEELLALLSARAGGVDLVRVRGPSDDPAAADALRRRYQPPAPDDTGPGRVP